jgi:hypothetical protein
MIRIAVILFSITVLVGCKSKQKIKTNNNEFTNNCNTSLNTKAELIAHYDTSGLQFDWIKIKAKINTTMNDKGISFKTSFRIKKDSLIFASITKAGIPFAKTLITKDSIKVIDLFHKKHKTGNFSELESLIGFKLPFNVMQKLLLGKPAFLYSNQGNIISDSLAVFSNDSTVDGYSQSLSFRCDTIDLKTMFIDHAGKNINIKYANPKDINGYLLNKNITISIKEGEKVIILSEIEIQRVKKFKTLKVPFSIPLDYERMD